MSRFVASIIGLAGLALATSFFLTGCGAIRTAPLPSSSTQLTPNPPKIYIAPMDLETGKWLVGRSGTELVDFKRDFQTNFQHQLEERLNKLAPTEQRWVDDLPNHGWLVAGQFITVFQGSRAERTLVGAGLGETTMQMNIYVYDLSISKTQYVLAFRTGVPDPARGTGAGSGSSLSGVSAAGEPISTVVGMGEGLKLDTTRTCREIAAILSQYM